MTTNNLYNIAERDGILILNFDLAPITSMSLLTEQDKCFIGIDSNLILNEKEERTVIVHEIGHCKKGAFYNRYSSCDLKSKHEYRADKWAIEKLIPKDEMEEAIKQGYEQVWELADYFDVEEELVKKAIWIYFDKIV